jgi:hypothetical protein
MKKTKNLWFKSKMFGWGWYPCTWQGVLVIFLAVLIFTRLLINVMRGVLVPLNIIAILVDFGILIYICYKKGEKPRWRWGK